MDNDYQQGITRRQLLKIAGLGTVMVIVEACAPGANQAASSAGQGSQPAGVNGGQGAPPATPAHPGEVAITSNKDFYTVYYRTDSPNTPSDWKLKVGGNVNTPLTLTLDELKQMPAVEEMRTLECISNPAGGPLISNAVWKGIKMADLLKRAGVKSDTKEIKLESYDGYSTAIPLDLANDDHALLVYEMNGEPLPLEHGKPLRCLWPGRYGMKQPKWLTTITAITTQYMGYWESQGWTDDAKIRPNSRIDVPSSDSTAPLTGPTLDMVGVGFSGASGIAKIEVSVDQGKTWQEAKLTRGPTPYVWTAWTYSGPLPPDGEQTLMARVTDNNGYVQGPSSPSLLGDTFPNGTDAMAPVIVTVQKAK